MTARELISDAGGNRVDDPAACSGMRVWCEFSAAALRYNLHTLKDYLPSQSGLMAVVKADAYGHGAVWAAREAERAGAAYLAVTTPEEGMSLRTAGCGLPILVLGPYLKRYNTVESYPEMDFDLTFTVGSLVQGLALAEIAEATGQCARVHLKLDTGMSRLGFSARPEDLTRTVTDILRLKQEPKLEIEGIFTHFAASGDPDPDYTEEQFQRFEKLIDCLRRKGVVFRYCHCANSSAIVRFPRMTLDLVRAGIMLYGCCSDPEIKQRISLRPVMSLFARLSTIRTIPAGEPVSYGLRYRAPRRMRIGVMEAGYADGLPRHLSNRGTVKLLPSGIEVPIIGTICMDRCMLDLSSAPDAREGDSVLIFGTSGQISRDPDELAVQADTISYELFCRVTARVPRHYPDRSDPDLPES